MKPSSGWNAFPREGTDPCWSNGTRKGSALGNIPMNGSHRGIEPNENLAASHFLIVFVDPVGHNRWRPSSPHLGSMATRERSERDQLKLAMLAVSRHAHDLPAKPPVEEVSNH
jgi:hypothetical protein